MLILSAGDEFPFSHTLIVLYETFLLTLRLMWAKSSVFIHLFSSLWATIHQNEKRFIASTSMKLVALHTGTIDFLSGGGLLEHFESRGHHHSNRVLRQLRPFVQKLQSYVSFWWQGMPIPPLRPYMSACLLASTLSKSRVIKASMFTSRKAFKDICSHRNRPRTLSIGMNPPSSPPLDKPTWNLSLDT